MLWMLSAVILLYALYLLKKLLQEAAISRKRSAEESRRLERQIELLEAAAFTSRYALPPAGEGRVGAGLVVKDLDTYRREALYE